MAGAEENKSLDKKILDARVVLKSIPSGEALESHQKEKIARAIAEGKTEQIKSPSMREAVVETLFALGITPEYLSQKLKEGVEATETKFFAHEGIVQDERTVDDHTVRLQYIRQLLRLLGLEGNKNSNRVSVKNFVYKPMLRGGGETVEIQVPKDTMMRRRMAASKAHSKDLRETE